MRRLSFRLMGAFGAVILVGAVVLVLLANRVTESEFQFYVTREGQQWAERLAPSLASFYAYNKSWNDVDTFLQTRGTVSSPRDMGSMMNRMGGMGGQGWNWGPMMGWDMWPLVDWRLVLTDAQGKVVADSANELIGQTIPADSLKNATPIQVDGRNVGSLAVTPGQAVPTTNTTAKDYLNSVNRSIILAVLASSAIALALGFILLRQITLPLSALTVAAMKIAAGDLKQRVELPDGDEIGELSHAFNTMADNLARQEEIRRNLLADIAHDLCAIHSASYKVSWRRLSTALCR